MICSIEGCEGKVVGRGWCNKHYRRWINHGDPNCGVEKRRDGQGTVNHGYVILQENHARKFVHVKVAENALGKPLPEGADVHHVNESRSDNRPGNLVICQDSAYHKLLHRRKRAISAGYPAHYLKCPFCKNYDAPENLRKTKTGQLHVECLHNYSLVHYPEKKLARQIRTALRRMEAA